MSSLPKAKVYFRWRCPGISDSEEVRVTGSCEELGNWTPTVGAVLRPDPVEPECLTSLGVPMPISRKVEYKYVICNKTTADCRWEEQPGNRVVVPTGQRHIVEDDGGKFRHILVGKALQRDKSFHTDGKALEQPGVMTESLSGSGLPRLQSFEEKLRKEKEQQVGPEDIVFLVFRTLPCRLERLESGEWKVELDRDMDHINFKVVSMVARATPDELISSVRFVGHPGVFTSDLDEQRKITEALAVHNCIPVFLDEQVMTETLEFCHRFLWPVMHNMKVFDDVSMSVDQENTHRKFREAQWKMYQVFNRNYAEVVEACVVQDKRTLVWIHDFYLLLTPRALKLRSPGVAIGFFLHSAFPSSEVMRCIPPREEILQSMLSCRVVTFQIFEYARHFLSCCQLLLNATYYFQGAGVLCIEHDSEEVVVRADHFVIPYTALVDLCTVNEKISRQAQAIRQEFGDKMIFASIDGDEPFSGMILKMRAFQKFLTSCHQHVHRVGLFQQVLARRVAGQTRESELMSELKRMADDVNKEFGQPGNPAVIIREGEVSVDDRLAILQAADVLLDTSINDGLNLHPFLFCVAHSQDKKGSMITSEFIGSSSVLVGATKVNPWHTQAVMDAMHSIVTQDDEERDKKFNVDNSYVSSQRLSAWLKANLNELKQARCAKGGPVKGLGAGGAVLFMERGYRHLSNEAVLHDYRQARSRVILLDNEGTLAPDRRQVIRPYGAQEPLDRAGRQPLDPQVLECLQALCEDRSNTVVVISGRCANVMEEWFGGIKDLGMCAEHGFYWVPPFKGKQHKGVSRWQCMQDVSGETDKEWKTICETLMKQYVKRVQGSILESKGSAVAWNYRKVGAQVMAKEIALQLTRFLDPSNGPESLMYGYPVRVVNGKGYVEVKRSDVDKGVSASRVLEEVRQRMGEVDFVLCIGDDRSDEDMFEVVNQSAKREGIESIAEDVPFNMPDASPKTNKSGTSLFSSSGPGLRIARKGSLTLEEYNPVEADKKSRCRYYTVTVGRKPSKAGYFLKDVGEVSDLLQRLALQARAAGLSRFSSMPMLVRSEDGDSD